MNTLRSDISALLTGIPADFGGGCSPSKAYLMAWLIRRFSLKVTVDIGVYRGRSLFPQALAHKHFTGGLVYGVDPWCAADAIEHDNPELEASIMNFVKCADFENIFQQVQELRTRLAYERHCVLLRQASAEAISYFVQNDIYFDLVHVDGNHDAKAVENDVELYLPRLRTMGFLVLDDISWNSVKPIYEFLRTRLHLVYQGTDKRNDYAVFWNCHSRFRSICLRLILGYVGYSSPERFTVKRICSAAVRRASRVLKLPGSLIEEAAVIRENHTLRRQDRSNLVILDDYFPDIMTAFRVAEFNRYLEMWPSTIVYSGRENSFVGGKRSFRSVLEEYATHYPHLASRVRKFHARRDLHAHAAYTVFLGNAFRFLDAIEAQQLPFVFTLYPGGGFQLDQTSSDTMLKRVCASRNLRRIIVTQKISYEYLMAGQFCDPAKVEFIYGGTLQSDRLLSSSPVKRHYKQDKGTLDICFVAQKYMPRGRDKGYDVFIEVAHLLAMAHADVFFHVVGPFGPDDIDVSRIRERIRFYGSRNADFFPDFYAHMDIILSPNAPFVRSPGAFDGFPTGCCAEAGLCGVAVFCTDILKQNVIFKDGDEIVIVSRDVAEICSRLEEYRSDYDELYRLSAKTQAAFQRTFCIEAQMKPRIRILSELMAAQGVPASHHQPERIDGSR